MGLAVDDLTRTDARMLDRAEGILLALRRCTIDDAFDEIVGASKRHRLPTLCIARALVELAASDGPISDENAAAAACFEWGGLFEAAPYNQR